jgi:hypothetical protein
MKVRVEEVGNSERRVIAQVITVDGDDPGNRRNDSSRLHPTDKSQQTLPTREQSENSRRMAVDCNRQLSGWTHLLFRPAAQVGRELARRRRRKGYSCRVSGQLAVRYASSYRRPLAIFIRCRVSPGDGAICGRHREYRVRGMGGRSS